MDRKLRQKKLEKNQHLRIMHNEMSVEQKIQLAANNKLYSNKKNEKGIRIITVICYFFSISFVAIILSAYYVFYWQPEYRNTTIIKVNNCGKYHIYILIL